MFVSNTNHSEDQPAHLTLKDAERSGAGQPGEVRRPGKPLLPGRRLRVRRRAPAASGCRSTRRTASTARPATSRTRPRTSSGSPPKAAAGRTTSACDAGGGDRPRRRRPGERRRLAGGDRCPSGLATPVAPRPRLQPPQLVAARSVGRVTRPRTDRRHAARRRGRPPRPHPPRRRPRARPRPVLGAPPVRPGEPACRPCAAQLAPGRRPRLRLPRHGVPSRARLLAMVDLLDRPHALRRRCAGNRVRRRTNRADLLPLAALADAEVRARHPERGRLRPALARRRCPRLRRRRAAPYACRRQHGPRPHQPRAALLSPPPTRRHGCAAIASCPCTDTRRPLE